MSERAAPAKPGKPSANGNACPPPVAMPTCPVYPEAGQDRTTWVDDVGRYLDDLTETLARNPELRRQWWEAHGGAPWDPARAGREDPPLPAAERARHVRQQRWRRRIRAIARQLLVEELPEAVALLTRRVD